MRSRHGVACFALWALVAQGTRAGGKIEKVPLASPIIEPSLVEPTTIEKVPLASAPATPTSTAAPAALTLVEKRPVRWRARKLKPYRLGFGVGLGTGRGPGDLSRRFFQDARAAFEALRERLRRRPVLGSFVSLGFAVSDDGRGTSGLPPGTRYTAGRADQAFFTLPQVSVSLDSNVGKHAQVHAQIDFPVDPIDPLGARPGLNEAYLLFQDFGHELALQVGGYSPPLASWEVNGPFLTLNDTITHSSVNTPFESGRVVGLALTNGLHAEADELTWNFGLYSGADTPATGGHTLAFGAMHDGLGLGSLSRLSIFDDRLGWYLDVEAPPGERRRAGWRASYQDAGGDLDAPRPSVEQRTWQLGAWRRWGRWRVQSQVAGMVTRSGKGVADRTSSRAGYLLVNRRLDENDTITLRHDRFWNRSLVQDDEGDAWTLAWNRALGRNHMFQFEWLRLEHEPVPGRGRADVGDDLVQFRYMVWF